MSEQPTERKEHQPTAESDAGQGPVRGAKESRRWMAGSLVIFGASAAAVAAIIISVIGLSPSSTVATRSAALNVDARHIAELASAVRIQETRLSAQATALASATADAEVAATLADVRAEMSVMKEKLERIERVLAADPVRAVELPMLRKDIEHLRTTHAENLVLLKDGIDRVHTVTLWVVGLIATSVFALGAQQWFARREH